MKTPPSAHALSRLYTCYFGRDLFYITSLGLDKVFQKENFQNLHLTSMESEDHRSQSTSRLFKVLLKMMLLLGGISELFSLRLNNFVQKLYNKSILLGGFQFINV